MDQSDGWFYLLTLMQNSPCDPCMVHCCMHWCALCQEHREMKNHLSENWATQMTVVNPPSSQQMNSGGNQESASDYQSTRNGSHIHLEIEPVKHWWFTTQRCLKSFELILVHLFVFSFIIIISFFLSTFSDFFFYSRSVYPFWVLELEHIIQELWKLLACNRRIQLVYSD